MVCASGRSFLAYLHPHTMAKLAPHLLPCRIGASIIIISTDGSIRAPVITLQGEKSNPYGVVEKHFRPDILIGAERFWKVGPSYQAASVAQATVARQCWMLLLVRAGSGKCALMAWLRRLPASCMDDVRASATWFPAACFLLFWGAGSGSLALVAWPQRFASSRLSRDGNGAPSSRAAGMQLAKL